MAVLDRFYFSWVWFGYLEGNQVLSFSNLKELISCFSHANVHAFHKNPDCIYTELTFFFTLKEHIKKILCFCLLLKYLKPPLTNNVDPDQTAPVEDQTAPVEAV